MLTGIAKVAYRGVKPVQGDSGETLLAAALREHAANYNVAAAIRRLEFRDRRAKSPRWSPYARRDEISGPVAAITASADGTMRLSSMAQINRFLTIRTPGSRLLLGPWSHQGENVSPFATALNDFDHTADIIPRSSIDTSRATAGRAPAR